MSQDRRQHPRIVSERFAFISIGGDPHQARMRDLAIGGICFEVPFPLSAGEMALIEVGPGRMDVQEPVRLPARVVWCTPHEDGFQIGAKFERLEERLAQRLGLLLADLAGDTPRSYRRPLTKVSPDEFTEDD